MHVHYIFYVVVTRLLFRWGIDCKFKYSLNLCILLFQHDTTYSLLVGSHFTRRYWCWYEHVDRWQWHGDRGNMEVVPERGMFDLHRLGTKRARRLCNLWRLSGHMGQLQLQMGWFAVPHTRKVHLRKRVLFDIDIPRIEFVPPVH